MGQRRKLICPINCNGGGNPGDPLGTRAKYECAKIIKLEIGSYIYCRKATVDMTPRCSSYKVQIVTESTRSNAPNSN